MQEDKQQRTEISDLGEFGLIDRLKSQVQHYQPSTLYGIGDDAAVIDIGQGECMLVSTDLLVEGVHFDLAYAPLAHVGYKAVAVNVSDIAAMNAIPQQITVSIALSNRFSVEAVEELYRGMRLACEQYHVDLVGGDTTASRSGLVISVTAMGRAPKDKIVYRNGAKKGDLICVTGSLGAAYIGLQLLEREKQVYLANPEMQPDLEKRAFLLGRQLKPEARTDTVHELAAAGVMPTAMMDISDGLASEVMHICKQSGVGAVLYEEKLPIDRETYEAVSEFQLPLGVVALNGGEDYELVFTVSQEDYEKVNNIPDVSIVGFVQEQERGLKLVTRANQVIDLQAQGWKHF